MSEKDCAEIFGREGQLEHEGIEMRGKRFYFIGICIILLAATLLPLSSAYAADGVSETKNVTVTLPSFSVSLNGQTLDNQYSKYPLLVYKDITYFPMTYYDCRLMGLKTEWDQQSGLSISKNDEPFYEYEREVTDRPNGTKQKAQLPDFNIQVNGKTIDNGTEEYPILLFRNVTYFPLTWRYAVNEFGWDYHFDSVKGLTVNAPDVVMENPNPWKVQIEPVVHLNGNDESVAIILNLGGTDTTPDPSSATYPDEVLPSWLNYLNWLQVSIYDQSEHSIEIENLQLEYQVYKSVNGKNELVYRLILPNIDQKMEPWNLWSLGYSIDFWNPSMHGKYMQKFVHSDTVRYRMQDTREERTIDFKDAQSLHGQATDQGWVIMK